MILDCFLEKKLRPIFLHYRHFVCYMLCKHEWFADYTDSLRLFNPHRKHSKQLKTSMGCLPSPRSPPNPSLWPTTTIRCPLYSGSLAMPYSMPAPNTDSITSPGKCARTSPKKRCRGEH